jgi:hypothetical protein
MPLMDTATNVQVIGTHRCGGTLLWVVAGTANWIACDKCKMDTRLPDKARLLLYSPIQGVQRDMG